MAIASTTLLLVEDNPDDELLTVRALGKHHVANRIAVARDGEEALARLGIGMDRTVDGAADLPQLVLLDLKIPKIDGREVLARIRGNERTRLLPVVILTSSREEQDVAEGYRLGANSYIRKPVDFEQFSEAIRQLGLYWLVLNEAPPGARP